MESEMFLKIRKQIDEELKVTPETIKAKTLKAPMLASRYHNVLINEKRLLDDLDQKRNKIYEKLYHHYKFPNDKCDFSLDKKNEIEIYIKANDDYIKINAQYNEQKIIVDYFEEHVKLFTNLGFSYGNYLGFLKIEHGET